MEGSERIIVLVKAGALAGGLHILTRLTLFLGIPRLSFSPSFLVDVPTLAKFGLARFCVLHDST